jgi:hypothetical protein
MNSYAPVVTRLIAGLILVFLVDASQLLLLVPDRTDELWAWEIQPEVTAMVLASAYVAGAYFFARVLFGAPWRQVAAGFPAVIVFVWMAAAATFLHLDRFIEDNLAFAAWIALYTITPIAIPLLYLYNQSRAPRREAGPELARGLRLTLGAAGLAVLALGVVMIVSPSTAMDFWPWTLTPLTARIMAAVVALYGTVWLSVAVDGSRLGARIPLEAHALGLTCVIVVLIVESETAPLMVAGAAVMLAGSLAVARQSRVT